VRRPLDPAFRSFGAKVLRDRGAVQPFRAEIGHGAGSPVRKSGDRPFSALASPDTSRYCTIMHDSPDLPVARRLKIADRLTRGETVAAAALAQEFGVSEDAIRRDLRTLAGQGVCVRVYGGALPLSPASRPIQARAGEDAARKRALAQAAAALLRPGQTVFLDAGSTTLQLAGLLPRDLGLRVVTNSLPAAAALMDRADLALILVGGVYDRHVGGCVDPRAAAEIARFRFDLCFLGACAMSRDRGLAGFDMLDVEFKRALIAASEAVALMLATAKLETSAPFAIAPTTAARHVLLEWDAPPDVEAGLRAAGLDVRRAPPPAP
jgi:DeoR/GlpR family transcriptional regulator of sugar metabolism